MGFDHSHPFPLLLCDQPARSLPETHSLPLKIIGWKMKCPFGMPYRVGPYQGIITPRNPFRRPFIRVITRFITGRGPPCMLVSGSLCIFIGSKYESMRSHFLRLSSSCLASPPCDLVVVENSTMFTPLWLHVFGRKGRDPGVNWNLMAIP